MFVLMMMTALGLALLMAMMLVVEYKFEDWVEFGIGVGLEFSSR